MDSCDLFSTESESETDVDQELVSAVSQDDWWKVQSLICDGVSDHLRTFALRTAGERADDYEICRLVRSCNCDGVSDILVVSAANRGLFNATAELIEQGVSEAAKKEAINNLVSITASGDGGHFSLNDILEHCDSDQIVSFLEASVTQGLWECVWEVLDKGVSEKHRRWAVDEAIRRIDTDQNTDLEKVLSYCTQDQIDQTVTLACERGLWKLVATLVERGINQEREKWVVDKAIHHFKEIGEDSLRSILPRCSDDQLEGALVVAIETQLWFIVNELLRRGVSHELQRKAVLAWSETYVYSSDDHYEQIIEYCQDDQLPIVIEALVKRRRWRAVPSLLDRQVSTELRHWVLKEATKTTGDGFLTYHILAKCSPAETSMMLPEIIESGFRETVKQMLQECQKDDERCKQIAQLIIKHDKRTRMLDLLHLYCGNHHFDSLLEFLVNGRHWHALEFLVYYPEDTVSKLLGWALEEASRLASEKELTYGAMKRCPDNKAEQIFRTLLERNMLLPACALLDIEHNIDKSLIHTAILKAIESGYYSNGFYGLFRQCPEEFLDSVFGTLVEKKAWGAVGVMISLKVSEPLRHWGLQEALRNVDDRMLEREFLRCYPDDCMEVVCLEAGRRRMWSLVDKTLVDRKLKLGPVAAEASKTARAFDLLNISLYCPHDHLDSVLGTVIKRKMWNTVASLVQSDISIASRIHAVESVLDFAGETDIKELRIIVFGSNRDTVDQMMANLLESGKQNYFQQAIRRSGVLRISKTRKRKARDVWQVDDSTKMMVSCISGLTRTMSQLVASGANPLAVNRQGVTLLSLAVRNKEPIRLVRECIKLGVSTHEAQTVVLKQRGHQRQEQDPPSLFRCAIKRCSTVLMKMLYESGAVSNQEMYELQNILLSEMNEEQLTVTYREEMHLLGELATNPRSLKSQCRLVISHCLGVHCGREDRAKQLPLPEQTQKYVIFTDLVEGKFTGEAVGSADCLLSDSEKKFDMCRRRSYYPSISDRGK